MLGKVTAITTSFVGTTDNLHAVNNWLAPAPIALWWTLPRLGLFSSFIPSLLLCLYIYSLFPGVIKMHFLTIHPIFSLGIHWTILMLFSNPPTNTSCILLCQSVKPVCLYFSFSSTCKVFSDEIFPIIQLSESEPGFKYTYSTTRASLCWLCGLHTITHTCTHIHTHRHVHFCAWQHNPAMLLSVIYETQLKGCETSLFLWPLSLSLHLQSVCCVHTLTWGKRCI